MVDPIPQWLVECPFGYVVCCKQRYQLCSICMLTGYGFGRAWGALSMVCFVCCSQGTTPSATKAKSLQAEAQKLVLLELRSHGRQFCWHFAARAHIFLRRFILVLWMGMRQEDVVAHAEQGCSWHYSTKGWKADQAWSVPVAGEAWRWALLATSPSTCGTMPQTQPGFLCKCASGCAPGFSDLHSM